MRLWKSREEQQAEAAAEEAERKRQADEHVAKLAAEAAQAAKERKAAFEAEVTAIQEGVNEGRAAGRRFIRLFPDKTRRYDWWLFLDAVLKVANASKVEGIAFPASVSGGEYYTNTHMGAVLDLGPIRCTHT